MSEENLVKMARQSSPLNLRKIELLIPQMGEGLQQVRVINLRKSPGDWVNEDEVIYEMETDKAIVEIESSCAGNLIKWYAKEQETLRVGDIICSIEVSSDKNENKREVDLEENQKEVDSLLSEKNTPDKLNKNPTEKLLRSIPPRTRAYCKMKGIDPLELLKISPLVGKQLMPNDVDRYLKNKSQKFYLTEQQQILNARFRRSQQQVIPTNIVVAIEFDKIKEATQILSKKYNSLLSSKKLSDFQVFSYFVSQTCVDFHKFRSVLIDDKSAIQHPHINLGVAVQSASSDLLTAVIVDADKLSFLDYINALYARIEDAIGGKDQAVNMPHIILTYLGEKGAINGAPLLVAPSISTLFLGASYVSEGKTLCNLSLTFDHRIINGIDGINFLNSISKKINEMVSEELSLNLSDANNDKVSCNDPFSQKKLILNEINRIIASLRNCSVNDLDIDNSFEDLGFDSLLGMKLAHRLEDTYKIKINFTDLYYNDTIRKLTDYLLKKIDKNFYSKEMNT